MNKPQEVRFNMFYATQEVMQENAAKWNTIPAMVTLNTEFDGNITAIEDAVEIQVKDITGHADDKANAEEAMISRTLMVAGGVMTYAVTTNNAGLAEEMNIVVSELRSYRDTVVAQRCQGVHAAATTNLANLADYGIVAADLTDLNTKIKTYVDLIARPRTMVTARSVATDNLDSLIKDTMKLLDLRMDQMMRRFTESEADFYSQYIAARIIIDQLGQGEEDVPAVA